MFWSVITLIFSDTCFALISSHFTDNSSITPFGIFAILAGLQCFVFLVSTLAPSDEYEINQKLKALHARALTSDPNEGHSNVLIQAQKASQIIGVDPPKLYLLERHQSIHCVAFRLDGESASLVFTDGVLALLSKDEQVALFCRELYRIKANIFKRSRKFIGLQNAARVILFLSIIPAWVCWTELRRTSHEMGYFLILAIIGGCFSVLSIYLNYALWDEDAKNNELICDKKVFSLLPVPSALISALKKSVGRKYGRVQSNLERRFTQVPDIVYNRKTALRLNLVLRIKTLEN